MGKLPGINHLQAVKALQRAGFEVVRQCGHHRTVRRTRIVTIPRHNPVNAFTMFAIVRDAGLTIEQFRDLL
jgi:predicted RNA binding protein YcfA (HicA-like mRNA interferase family)